MLRELNKTKYLASVKDKLLQTVNNSLHKKVKIAEKSTRDNENKSKKDFVFRPKDPYILSQTVQNLIVKDKLEKAHSLLINVPVSEQHAIAWSILIGASADQKKVKLCWLLFNQVNFFDNYLDEKTRNNTYSCHLYAYYSRLYASTNHIKCQKS